MRIAVILWRKRQWAKLEKQLSSEEITEHEFENAMREVADEYEAMEEEFNGGKERF
jgi:hypothetical protein